MNDRSPQSTSESLRDIRNGAWLFLGLVLVLGLLALLVDLAIESSAVEAVQDRTVYRHVAVSDRYVAQDLYGVERLLRGVAERIGASPLGLEDDSRSWLEPRLERQPIVYDLQVIDAGGRTRASLAGSPRWRQDHRDQEYFTVHRSDPGSGVWVAPEVSDPHSDHRLLPVSIRLADSDGAFGGVVLAMLLPTDWRNYFRALTGERVALFALVDTRARVLMAERIPGGDNPLPDSLSAWVLGPALESGHADLVRGNDWVFGVSRLVGLPLAVVVAEPLANTRAAWQQDALQHLLVLGVLVSILAGVTRMVHKLIESHRRSVDQLQSTRAELTSILETTAEGIVGLEPDGCIRYANRAALKLLDYPSLDRLVGRAWYPVVQSLPLNLKGVSPQGSEPAGTGMPDCVRRAFAESRERTAVGENLIRSDGSQFKAEIHAVPVGPATPTRGLVVSFQDISERLRSIERIRFIASHDPLTRLLNRGEFLARFRRALRRAGRNQQGLGLLFIDLDRFKPINDNLGHAVGDQVLKVVAERIRKVLRETDMAGRFGGDEFVVLVDAVDDRNLVGTLSAKIRDRIIRPIGVDGNEITLDASIGTSFYPEDGEDMEQLIEAADGRMYESKRRHRARLVRQS